MAEGGLVWGLPKATETDSYYLAFRNGPSLYGAELLLVNNVDEKGRDM